MDAGKTIYGRYGPVHWTIAGELNGEQQIDFDKINVNIDDTYFTADGCFSAVVRSNLTNRFDKRLQ